MRSFSKNIFHKVVFLISFCAYFLSSSFFVSAVGSSVQVQQEVIYDGSGGVILPIDATPPVIFDVQIYDIGLETVKISWQTNDVCLTKLYYGKTEDFEFGPLFDHPESYETSNNFSLEGLEPGTKYYLKIEAENQKGAKSIITTYYFYTIPEFKILPNVGSLAISQGDKKVFLNWKNPGNEDFQGIQINRQIGSPAFNVNEGEKIFFGFADSFVDANVSDRTKYYYTVFSFDAGNNFSSGAIISIETNFFKSEEGDGGGNNNGSGDGENNNNSQGVPTEIESPASSDVFIQDIVNLQATANASENEIVLSWDYPEIENASEVEIRRDLNFPASSPWEGDLIYSGKGTFFIDKNLKEGQFYFYTVFTKNADGIYSKGKVIVSELGAEDSEVVEFDEWKDTNFVDLASGILLSPENGERINILQNHLLGISYGVEILPENLKAVGVRIEDAFYILDYNEDSQSYQTSFMVPEETGEYDLDIVFLNFDDTVFFEKNMKLRVLPLGKVFAFENEELFCGKLSVEKAFCFLENFLGGENRKCMRQVVVSDAEIEISWKNRDGVWEIWNAQEFNQENPSFTDSYGNFGFSLPDGEYQIGVKKNGFADKKISISVSNATLNSDIQIYVKNNRMYDIMIVVFLMFFVAILLKRKKR
ncbi:MAG: fibronectin type III domain-containing protein [Candidatus Paceibacterota bacterium]